MSIEHALVARAGPHMLAEKARRIVLAEASKGCTPDFYPEPVALEPAFNPARRWQAVVNDAVFPVANPEPAPTAAQLARISHQGDR